MAYSIAARDLSMFKFIMSSLEVAGRWSSNLYFSRWSETMTVEGLLPISQADHEIQDNMVSHDVSLPLLLCEVDACGLVRKRPLHEELDLRALEAHIPNPDHIFRCYQTDSASRHWILAHRVSAISHTTTANIWKQLDGLWKGLLL